MLLWIEGHDSYGTTPGNVVDGFSEVYPDNANLATIAVQAGRLAQNSTEVRSSSGNSYYTTPNLGNMATVIVGTAFKPAFALTTNIICELREDDNGTQGMNVLLNSTGTLSVRRGTTVLATTAAIMSVDVWHYIEFKVTVHDTTGAYELKVNGVSQLSATSVDTKAGATNNYANRVRFYGVSGVLAGRGHWYDDQYIADATGSINNDFLGDRRVQTIFPNVDGDQTDFSLSTGTDSFALVDDNPLDDDSTYVESSTSGHRDLYQFENLVAAQTVNGVQQHAIARKTDVTNFDIQLVVKSATTVSEGSNQTVGSTTYGDFQRVVEQNPDTSSAWTLTTINAAQFGYDVG